MLRERDFVPQRQFGQCFLIDLNLMAKVLELADLKGDETVLEVGPGTGSLTEELLSRAKRVVTVEIDRGLCQLLRENFADRPNFTLICGDVLAGKHAISPEVIAALGEGSVNLISNLPYNVATPLIAECLVSTWRRVVGGDSLTCRFERLTFTVQREVADPAGCLPRQRGIRTCQCAGFAAWPRHRRAGSAADGILADPRRCQPNNADRLRRRTGRATCQR